MGRIHKVVREEVLIDRYGKIVMNRHFKDPDGKTRDFLLWGGKVTPAIILPITSDNRIVVIKSFRRAANESLVEIPGGNPEIREDIEACARRELLEETGYTAGEIIGLGPPIWFEPSSCFTQFYPLLALGCQNTSGQNLEETEKAEDIEIILIKLAEWLKMIRGGEIRDSKTVTITFLALPHLLKHETDL